MVLDIVIILMMSAKMATTDLLKKVFWNEGHDVIISVRNVTKKYYYVIEIIVDVVMWPSFSNSRISMRKVIIFFWGVVLVQAQ